jgi:hypothetical protein
VGFWDSFGLLEAPVRWRARRRASVLLARLRDSLRRAAGQPASFLDEAVRALVAETAASGGALYVLDTKASLDGIRSRRWACFTTTGAQPSPEVLAVEADKAKDGRANVGAVADGHLIMRIGEVPNIGPIGALVVTPARGVWARTVVQESLQASADLMSMAVTQLWLGQHVQSIAALVGHTQILPEIVGDLTAAVDTLRPLTEAAEVRRLQDPEQLLRVHAAVDRALAAVDRLVAGPGWAQPLGMIDIVGLIRERLSLRPPSPAGEPVCNAIDGGPYRVFGDRAGLVELIDRLLDYNIARDGSAANVEVRTDGTGEASTITIAFVDNPAAGGTRLMTAAVLRDVWRARCEELVATHSGQLEFPAEGRDSIRVRLPVRPTTRIAER